MRQSGTALVSTSLTNCLCVDSLLSSRISIHVWNARNHLKMESFVEKLQSWYQAQKWDVM